MYIGAGIRPPIVVMTSRVPHHDPVWYTTPKGKKDMSILSLSIYNIYIDLRSTIKNILCYPFVILQHNRKNPDQGNPVPEMSTITTLTELTSIARPYLMEITAERGEAI